MLYVIQKGGRGAGRILRNIRAIVLQWCGQCKCGGVIQGGLIRAQKPRSERISCKGQETTPYCVCNLMHTVLLLRKHTLLVFGRGAIWPLQDIVSLRDFGARINHPFTAPSHLHCPHYSNAIARLLGNIRRPPDPSCVCNTSYHIGNGNIV